MRAREFRPVEFPPWAQWGQRRGIIIDRRGWPRGPNGRQLCKWCRNECAPRRSSYCSDECVEAISPFWTWATLKSWVERRDKATCQRCRTTDPPKPNHGGWSGRTDPWDVDHIVPVADGGTDDPLNLRLLCIPCHVAVGYEQRGARRDDDSDQQVLPLEGAA